MLSISSQLLTTICLSFLCGLGVYLYGRRTGRLKGGWLDLTTELVLAQIGGLSGFYLGQYKGWEDPAMFLAVLCCSNNGIEVIHAGKKFISNARDAFIAYIRGAKS